VKELEQILNLWTQAEEARDSAVLATVVKTCGSAYRLPGARLLLTSTGRRAGSVSGGCLEDDLVKKAWWLTEKGPAIRRYDTTPEGEIASGYGLGCNGIIYVLLERVTPSDSAVLQLIRGVRAQRRPAAIAHLIEPPAAAGERLVMDPDGGVLHNLADQALAKLLHQETKTALRELVSRTVALDSGREAFIEVLTPAVHLLVFGAGDDAVPLTELGKFLGWNVSVFDGRAHYARREKFPRADQVTVRSAQPAATMPPIDPWTVAVLMSHSYTQDLENLRQLSSQPLRYLGILGPRKRTLQLLADAGLSGDRLAPALHSPMGLDIGADGPQQVALSVVAEIQAALNAREGGLLRDRQGSIHAPEESLCAPSLA
jgi:xanthine/CO dehydrogenase XdhC/CoxF family maturation factor